MDSVIIIYNPIGFKRVETSTTRLNIEKSNYLTHGHIVKSRCLQDVEVEHLGVLYVD